MADVCFHFWKMIKVTHLLKRVQWNEIIEISEKQLYKRMEEYQTHKIKFIRHLVFITVLYLHLHGLKCRGLGLVWGWNANLERRITSYKGRVDWAVCFVFIASFERMIKMFPLNEEAVIFHHHRKGFR